MICSSEFSGYIECANFGLETRDCDKSWLLQIQTGQFIVAESKRFKHMF